DYFDGSSQPTDDQTFSWEGATSNSRSFANGVTPFGWTVFDGSVTPVGGNLQRITGGFSGSHGALLTFENNGVLQAGIHPDYAASVEEGQTYFGSMYVSPPREGFAFV